MAHSLEWIARVKAALGADQDSHNDDPLPSTSAVKTQEGFSSLCSNSGVPEDIVKRAWARSGNGKSLNKVSDVVWCLMNCDEASATNRRDRREGANAEQFTPEIVEATALLGYYRKLFLDSGVFTQQEWDSFVRALCAPLPMTLRTHTQGFTKPQTAQVFLREMQPVVELVPAVARLGIAGCSEEAYRGSRAAQDLSRTAHSGGCLSFQELVSALPVATLGILPSHRVLDMCAAPGSKSLQVLDFLNSNSNKVSAAGGTGCLIANELQPTKARQILPARMKKYHALQAIVTCADASKLPWLVKAEGKQLPHQSKQQKEEDAAAATAASNNNNTNNNNNGQEDQDPRAHFYFDRIVCDVPCSGDGTVRKDRSILGTWNLDYVKNLSTTQLNIARRGATMLEPNGGRMAYSTCSMNPIEDEHVVLQLLCLSKGSLRLVDANEELAQRHGVRLNSRGAGMTLSGAALDEAIAKVPQLFRPESAEAASKLAADIARCTLRVFPHRDDTGGFFVALFEKVPSVVPAPTLPASKRWQHWSNRKRFELVSPDDEEWLRLTTWFGLSFTQRSVDSLLDTAGNSSNSSSKRFIVVNVSPTVALVPLWFVSQEGKRKKINFTTLAAAKYVFAADLAGGVSELVSVGARAFERMQDRYMTNVEQRLRATTEAAEMWGELATRRVVTFNVKFEVGAEQEQPPQQQQQQQREELVYQMLYNGSCCFTEATLPRCLTDSSALTNPETATGNAGVLPGSFLVKMNISRINKTTGAVEAKTTLWCGAIVTSMLKVDLLVDYSTRRMILLAYAGVVLPFAADEDKNEDDDSHAKRRKREGDANGKGGDDDDDDDDQGLADDEGEY